MDAKDSGRELIGHGKFGPLYREGDFVLKNLSPKEQFIHEVLSGCPGIADVDVRAGATKRRFYPDFIKTETIDPEHQRDIAEIVFPSVCRINQAVTALSLMGFSYNQPLQFGVNEKGQLDLLGFDKSYQHRAAAMQDNFALLGDFYRRAGLPEIAEAVLTTSDIFHAQREGRTRDIAEEDAPLFESLDAVLEGRPATHAYYTLRDDQPRYQGLAITSLSRSGPKMILTCGALSQNAIDLLVLTPVIHVDEVIERGLAQQRAFAAPAPSTSLAM